MKLLIINSLCDSKSTGSICLSIAKQYRDLGFDVAIAYGRSGVTKEDGICKIRIGSKFDVFLHTLKSRLFDMAGFGSVQSTRRFIKWAETFNPDIVWIHNLHGYYINVALLFDWIKSRPQMQIKWTLHDCWSFTGHCTHFECIQCEKWKSGCHDCQQVRNYPKSLFIDRSKLNYKRKKEAFTSVSDMTIITPSIWLRNLVSQSFLKDYSIEVVNNKIDRNVFFPRERNYFKKNYDLNNRIIILGVASDWDEKKGLEDFIKLSCLLSNEYQIVLVGLTDKQLNQIPRNIIGIKRTNSADELAEIYSSSDLFLNLTYQDTYPTVNLEAQACGTPCITYRTGGSPESVPAQNVVSQGDLVGVLDLITQHKYSNSCEGI